MVLTTMLVIFEDRVNKGDSNVARLQEKFGLMLQHLMNLESRRQVRDGKNKFAVS